MPAYLYLTVNTTVRAVSCVVKMEYPAGLYKSGMKKILCTTI